MIVKADLTKLTPFPQEDYFLASISPALAEELGLEPGIYELILNEENEIKTENTTTNER